MAGAHFKAWAPETESRDPRKCVMRFTLQRPCLPGQLLIRSGMLPDLPHSSDVELQLTLLYQRRAFLDDLTRHLEAYEAAPHIPSYLEALDPPVLLNPTLLGPTNFEPPPNEPIVWQTLTWTNHRP